MGADSIEANRLRLGSRTLANVTRALGGSLPLALLGPILSHRLDVDEFAVWILVVQIASYVNYLEFGVQTAVSRTVAYRAAQDGPESTGGAMAAGVHLLLIIGSIGLVLVGAAVATLPHVVDIPGAMTRTARVALVVLGCSAAAMLPGSAIHGALVGAGRHWWSAITVLSSRVLSVAMTVFGAYQGWPVEVLALCLACGTVGNGVGPFLVAARAGLPSPWRRATREDVREIGGITWTVGTWTIATLIISGIDVLVVGVVDYPQVSAYGLAASLTIVATAAYGIMSSVLIPAFADLAARDDHIGACRLLAKSAASSSAALGTGLIVGLAVRDWLLDLWAGRYADEAVPVFVVLLITAAIRLSMSPVATYVMGFGFHHRARTPAIVEAGLNLSLSIALGITYGALGVALGSLLASVSAVALYLGRVGPAAVGHRPFRHLVLPLYVSTTLAAAPFVVALVLVDRPLVRLVTGLAGAVVQVILLRYSLTRLSSDRVSASAADGADESFPGEHRR